MSIFMIECLCCGRSVQKTYIDLDDMQRQLYELTINGWIKRTLTVNGWFCSGNCAYNFEQHISIAAANETHLEKPISKWWWLNFFIIGCLVFAVFIWTLYVASYP